MNTIDSAASPWFTDHRNLAALWSWLDDNHETPGDGPAYFMEKPYKWGADWLRYLAWREDDFQNRTAALADPEVLEHR